MNEREDSTQRDLDMLKDRLADVALREVLGGQNPPDLSARILSAVDRPDQSQVAKSDSSSKRRRRATRWFSLPWAAAACLMLLVTAGVVAMRFLRVSATRPMAVHRMKEALRDPKSLSAAVPAAEVFPLSDHSTAIKGTYVGVMGGPANDERRKPHYVSADVSGAAHDRYDEASSQKEATAFPTSLLRTELTEDLSRPGDAGAELDGLGDQIGEGSGPELSGDQYARIVENEFLAVSDHPLSTFSVDVDTASYANVRQYLLQHGVFPPPDAVRIEELINYFSYDYAPPQDAVPFAAHVEIVSCPWQPEHRLVRVGLKGREIESQQRLACNLVFLIDVSGSMSPPEKLPLLQESLKRLAEHLEAQDRVAIVVYASAEGLVLPSTPGSEREKVTAVLDNLQAGGSTNGGAGIELAYRIAQENFIREGVNRVMLCTDGDFNVGTTSTAALERLVEEKAKTGTFLTVLGFGRGNLNDEMMEAISGKGNGNYHYIDRISEAQKVLVEEMGGTLVTIAKDVKIQIEFNPAEVAAYRLIGYENRMLAAQDFNDDTKDAGEIGAGHTVTALYEIVPAGQQASTPSVDSLKYRTQTALAEASQSGEFMTIKLRYKEPDGTVSSRLEIPVRDEGKSFSAASGDTKFAAAVASFGLLLRDSKYKGNATYDAVLEIAADGKGEDRQGHRSEFIQIVQRAKEVAKAASE